jgi:hypothetical protein
MHPVKVQKGSRKGFACASGHSAPLFFNSTVATNRTRPVTSTGASGQYEKY